MEETKKPAEPYRRTRSFTIGQVIDANGVVWVHRTNDDFTPYELIALLEETKLDILLQLNTDLAERTKRTIITRDLVEPEE